MNRKSFFYHPNINFGSPLPNCYVREKKNIPGYQIKYLGDSIPKNIKNFYENKLKRADWEIDSDFNADGPFGNAWGYRKKNNIAIFMLKAVPIENDTNILMSRIKEYELTIFSNNKNLFSYDV